MLRDILRGKLIRDSEQQGVFGEASTILLKSIFAKTQEGRGTTAAQMLANALEQKDVPVLNEQDEIFRRSEDIKSEKIKFSKNFKIGFHTFQFLGGGGLAASAVMEACVDNSAKVIDYAGRLGTGLFNMVRNVWQVANLNKAKNSFEESQREIMNNVVSATGNSMQPIAGLAKQDGKLDWMDKDVLPGTIALGVYSLRTGNYLIESKIKKGKYEEAMAEQPRKYHRAFREAIYGEKQEIVERSTAQKAFDRATDISLKTLFMIPSIALVGRGIAQTVTGMQAKDTALIAGGIAQTLGPLCLTVGDYAFQYRSQNKGAKQAKENIVEFPIAKDLPKTMSMEEALGQPKVTQANIAQPVMYKIA